MNVLLSIKPEYVDRIISGEKKYEFRRTKIITRRVNHVFIYSTAPVKKIIGEMTYSKVIEGSPEEIWDKCQEYSGISKEDYFKYFNNCKKAYAIEIKDIELFDEPIDPYIKFIKFVPPQSFCYINSEMLTQAS